MGVGACGCTCVVETLEAEVFLGADAVEGRVGAAIGVAGAAGAAVWGIGFAFCAGTRSNREEAAGSDFGF